MFSMRTTVVLILLLPCCGCATATSTFFNGPEFYGGVRSDARGIRHAVAGTDPQEGEGFTPSAWPPGPLGTPVLAADMVFSACADTLILPFWAMRELDPWPEPWLWP